LILHRAAWVIPIVSPPIRDGWVAVENGRVAAVGGPDSQPPVESNRVDDRSSEATAILPGLVNAHTHLELSWMRGAPSIQRARSMPAWVAKLLALRLTEPTDPPEPVSLAVSEVRATGTALVGDVTNTLASWGALADSHLSAVIFRELLGFNTPDPESLVRAARSELGALLPLAWIRHVIVPHAPYSVSPELFRAIAATAGDGPISIHVGESPEEIEFLLRGTGAWRQLIEQVGAWTDGWSVPACPPVDYLDRLGLVDARLMAVHCVHLSDPELARLAAAGATVVTCPRSNRWTGAGTPPIDRFYSSGVRVAVGTDSLASVEDLNMFAELAVVRQLAPDVAASRILRSATLDGAEALGFAGELGSIEPGKRAELIGVRIPSGVEDVEEYLLSGLTSADLRWLEAD
jgi:aminodeoxyfutalosine deaminase